MPDEKKAVAGAAKGLDPGVLAGEIKKEQLRQKQFAPMWGELCQGPVPRSVDEALELARKEMAELTRKVEAKTGKDLNTVMSQTTSGVYDEDAALPKPEEGYNKGYKVMRAGV